MLCVLQKISCSPARLLLKFPLETDTVYHHRLVRKKYLFFFFYLFKQPGYLFICFLVFLLSLRCTPNLSSLEKKTKAPAGPSAETTRRKLKRETSESSSWSVSSGTRWIIPRLLFAASICVPNVQQMGEGHLRGWRGRGHLERFSLCDPRRGVHPEFFVFECGGGWPEARRGSSDVIRQAWAGTKWTGVRGQRSSEQ